MRVRRVLESVIAKRGQPKVIVVDNGPEFRGRVLAGWSEERRVRLQHIEPGKPVQNAYIESFNGRLRVECLNGNLVCESGRCRRKIEAWQRHYNEERRTVRWDISRQQFAQSAQMGAVQ